MPTFSCPICGQLYQQGEAGVKFACQNCGQRLEVPPAPAALNKTVLGKVEEARGGAVMDDSGKEPFQPSVGAVALGITLAVAAVSIIDIFGVIGAVGVLGTVAIAIVARAVGRDLLRWVRDQWRS